MTVYPVSSYTYTPGLEGHSSLTFPHLTSTPDPESSSNRTQTFDTWGEGKIVTNLLDFFRTLGFQSPLGRTGTPLSWV